MCMYVCMYVCICMYTHISGPFVNADLNAYQVIVCACMYLYAYIFFWIVCECQQVVVCAYMYVYACIHTFLDRL